MNLFLKLAYAFFKIGILTVGGGLAMIPIVQHEMVNRGWMDNQQFLDILGIAQMTPGPVSVNTATFVGYRVIAAAYPASVWMAVAGAVVGTLSVCAPSVLCINLFGSFWRRHRDHPCMVRVFGVLRPLVTGLVITAAVLLVRDAVWGGAAARPDWTAVGIVAGAFALTAFTKISPVWVMLGGGAVGLLLGLA